MKTEHACAYLPYGLNGINCNGKIATLHIHGYDIFGGNDGYFMSITSFMVLYKPILRPLSDLTKEITNDGETFVPMKKFGYSETDYYWTTLITENVNVLNWHYVYVQNLLSWRFDVFNLIESGEAIDVNTLEKNPYE